MVSVGEPLAEPVSKLGKWLREIVETRYGGVQKRLADQVGISDSVFNRGIKSGSYDVNTLLRIAKETGRSPSEILRLAGKADYADLIETLYGAPRPTLPRDVQQVVDALQHPAPSMAAWQRETKVAAAALLAAHGRIPLPNATQPSASAPAGRGTRGTRGTRPK